ncbi:MAG: inositol-3-phosphate synthase [Deltaproteobacteria bacterium]|nr:inositol-3-phosphate synthase [Deltaproteobacteria bacterium]
MGKIGVWLAGAKGAIATTLLVGASALARGLTKPLGLVTELPEFASLGLVSLDRLVFGGWDVVSTSSVERARELAYADRMLPGDLVESVRGELEAFDGRICAGFIANGIPSLSSSGLDHKESLSATVKRLERDLEHFRNEHNLQNVIVVNLTPTEPPLPLAPEHKQLDGFRKLIEENRYSQLTPSILYAYIALGQGLPFVNFTPSVSVTLPALLELAKLREVPFCGSDGKTGETLLKAVLAPLFRSRNLEVLSWQGFNILGGGDGEVLNDPSSKRAKVESKERVLEATLGYRPHSGVFIEYVPSLGNWKTAWDFIHFRGFLGTKMSVQFTWQGCDAILAAPLVLDLVRLAEFAHRNGEVGALSHLACFFKNPQGTDVHSFPDQFRLLLDYVERHACKVNQ